MKFDSWANNDVRPGSFVRQRVELGLQTVDGGLHLGTRGEQLRDATLATHVDVGLGVRVGVGLGVGRVGVADVEHDHVGLTGRRRVHRRRR